MAEMFLFNIAQRVLGKLSSLALQEVWLAWDTESELDKLKSTISTIQAVLLDAEEQQENNHQLTDWLGKIKDALYDADDMLDEFQYEALRSQVVNRGGIKRKVCNFFSCSNPFAFRFKMGHKIRDIRGKLDVIAAEKTKFHLTERLVDRRVVHVEREMTHSFVRGSEVIGRDADKANIVQLLMQPAGDGQNVSVIPIVGIGGLGKTTLAKLVYNDERVVNHFELRMWVCVSVNFDVRRLGKDIINSANGTNYDDLTMDQMQSCLRDTLDGKNFLLVLDDVWNEDQGKWIELRDLLSGGANGSKVVVTTRSLLVASIMSIIPAYILTYLSHRDCLSLFVKWAFREGEEKQHPHLLIIGDQIVYKCGGIPLAVRTLGSLLYLKTDERDWLLVRDSEIWKLEQKENDILPALKLSYDAMPLYLKQCFVFCSAFPKDYAFIDLELIQFWIAQGLLQSPSESQELEDLGQQYIKELWSRSFIENVEYETFNLTFKIHDLVHDLALSVAQTEYLSLNFRTHKISKRIRHVSFPDFYRLEEGIPRFLLELDSLRTIIKVGYATESFVETCISKFMFLRVLDLSDSNFEVLPKSIDKLKHLRYLDLCRNFKITKLPNSICKLWNLQTLLLHSCRKLEELPRNIGNLISLRCLILTTRQMLLPEGIGHLLSLRLLWISRCGNLKSLGEGMHRLIALRTLIIVNCDSLEFLPRNMKYLIALETLIISGCGNLTLTENEEDVQGLKLSFRSLTIKDSQQVATLPGWLRGATNTLQEICIENCQSFIALPEWMPNLTSLKKLQIRDCPELLALPEEMHRLTALRKLKIRNCPQLSRRCKRETGEDWPKIAHVPEFDADDKGF